MVRWLAVISIIAVSLPSPAPWYSVLTHEAIIDSSWPNSLRPLLLKRFPGATADNCEAHAYAYGGAIVRDMGYYPFGGKDTRWR
jgi:hypothetical protein